MSEQSPKNNPSQKAARPANRGASKEGSIKETETAKEQIPGPGQRLMGTLLPTLQPTIVPTLTTTSIYGGYSTIATILSTSIPIVTMVYRTAAKKGQTPKRKASRKRR
jgi:hypothetical protein